MARTRPLTRPGHPLRRAQAIMDLTRPTPPIIDLTAQPPNVVDLTGDMDIESESIEESTIEMYSESSGEDNSDYDYIEDDEDSDSSY